MTHFKVQIISDSVCPWCYVGFRRLSRAIAAHRGTHPGDTFSLIWKPFYLNPASPGYPGVNKREMYNLKFGAERVAAMFTRLSAVGQAEDINFQYGGNTGSTRDSHRLIWYAGQEEMKREAEVQAPASGSAVGGLQSRVVEKLFRAYFEEEKNITDSAVLLDAAVNAGLDRDEVQKLLDSDAGGAEVDAEAQTASRRLVTGVPYFTVQGRYAVEGADEPETFLEIFERVKREE
ncbi:hypothetical protein N7492_004350 [Penicillium capsulatum]|uniref:DSBA-like thioredoxin domain-containing protein n=1 Tax=Penicillium capsulatum TaxID=69766 RepID=A0A9W9IBE2_9EURO|nr:hypothetical protein N7492_004350 [Penicillium capsulatum]KAJ6136530.1 hypothetical protein N7512_001690 [Penicillium capsulatum]